MYKMKYFRSVRNRQKCIFKRGTADKILSNRLKNIVENNKKEILEHKISIDKMDSSKLDFAENAEQVDLFNTTAFTRITLFESGRLYIQTLNMETEETLYFFDDILDKDTDLENFVIQAITRM